MAVEGRGTAPGAAAFGTSSLFRERKVPARSKAQQMAAGAALAAKRGEAKKSELKGASREMYESMTEAELEEFAHTKRKGLPDKKSD